MGGPTPPKPPKLAAAQSAQAAVALLLRDHLGPELRALGFKGSGASWTADRPGFLVGLGIQRSVHGDRAATEFTVNLTVAAVATWAALRRDGPYLPARPAPNTRYGPAVWQRRIGMLMPDAADRWWTITADTDRGALGREVLSAITRYALPAIEREARS